MPVHSRMAPREMSAEKRVVSRIVEIAAIAHRHRKCGWETVAAMPRTLQLIELARKELHEISVFTELNYDSVFWQCWHEAERKSRKVRYSSAGAIKSALMP